MVLAQDQWRSPPSGKLAFMQHRRDDGTWPLFYTLMGEVREGTPDWTPKMHISESEREKAVTTGWRPRWIILVEETPNIVRQRFHSNRVYFSSVSLSCCSYSSSGDCSFSGPKASGTSIEFSDNGTGGLSIPCRNDEHSLPEFGTVIWSAEHCMSLHTLRGEAFWKDDV